MNIDWAQVIIAFILGVLMSAMVKSAAGKLRGKVQGA